MPFALAWRNVVRHGRRSLLTATAMGIGVALCMVILAVTNGMYGQMRDILITQQIGHVVISHPDRVGRRAMHDTVDAASLGSLAALPEVKGILPRLEGSALLGGKERTRGVQLLGVEPAVEAGVRQIDRKVVSGRWLGASPAAEIVVGEGLAKKLEVSIGEAVVAVTQSADGSMGNELYTVVGLASTGSTAMDESGAWVHLADLQRLLVLEGRLHEVAVLTTADETGVVEALATAVTGALPEGVSVRRWWEVDPTIAEMMNMQAFSSSIIIGLFQGVAALGVINTLLMSVSERTRELGVLLAVGLRPRQVIGMVVAESLLLGLLGTAGGLLIGGLLDWYLVEVGLNLAVNGEGFSSVGMQFDPIIRARVTTGSVLQPVIGVFLFATLASLWPAWRASRLDPIQAIRQE